MIKKKIGELTITQFEKEYCRKDKCWDCPLNHFLVPCHSVLHRLATSEKEIEVEENGR